jgi:ABC-type transport system involved in Fe-S cluster assembly fused permease/ATPase subunit
MAKSATNNSEKYSITYFFRFFKPYMSSVVLTFLFLITARLALTYDPVLLKQIIDGVSSQEPLSGIFRILTFYFIIRFSATILEFLRDYIYSPVEMGVSRDIETAVFNHLLKLPVSYHADQRAGNASRALARGSRAIGFVLDFSVSQILPPIFELLFVTILLLKLYSWDFGVITLGTIVVYTVFTVWGTEKRSKYRTEGNIQDDNASGILVDSISNIDTVKFFNNESIQFNRFSVIKENWRRLMTRNNRLFALVFSGQALILLVGLGLILVSAVRQAVSGVMTVGDLVLVSTYIVRLSGPVTTLGFVYGQFKNSFSDLEAMSSILHHDISLKQPSKPTPIEKPKGEVVFKNVFFNYPTREKTIEDLSFHVKPGEKVAFVGPSGSGKSTIARLLFRLYDIKGGDITIDNVSIKQIDGETRRRILSIVTQEPTLFNDSIADNIRFGNPDATDQEVKEAAQIAGIDHFIDGLPQKYDTLVGERGIKLSGGEKQRVAIARALIRNPKIIVFDEATSNLDSRTEKAIQKTLADAATGRTTLTIAHRLSTITNSDTIYVLEKGHIKEKGTHKQLLAKKDGLYAKLWAIQSKNPDAPHDEVLEAEAAAI